MVKRRKLRLSVGILAVASLSAGVSCLYNRDFRNDFFSYIQRTGRVITGDKYPDFSTVYQTGGKEKRKADYAALRVYFNRISEEELPQEVDVLGIIDLRRRYLLLSETNRYKKQDFISDAKDDKSNVIVYMTSEAKQKIKDSEKLRKKVEGIFSLNKLEAAIVSLPDSELEKQVKQANILGLLPYNTNKYLNKR